MHDRVVLAITDVRVRALGMAPIRLHDLAPPWCPRHPAGGGKVVGEQSTKNERPSEAFGVGPPTGAVDELGKALVGDSETVDLELRQGDVVDWSLTVSGVAPVRLIAHAVQAGRHRHQRGRATHAGLHRLLRAPRL